MAVPKGKTSKSKSRSRRSSAWNLSAPARGACPHCGGQVVWYDYSCNECGEEVIV